ncbi:MAG TPA: hypothetical protein VHA11_04140, partial [Bryobacteraceae bacterium]|nr:hypothetical protein [Bryobacteraceae bacterium]
MFRLVSYLLVLVAGQCCAQWIGIGVKGGVRASDDVSSYEAQSESKRYAIGPMIDVALPFGFGAEVDALYRPSGFRTANGSFWGSYEARYRADTWEFPMLLKYRLRLPLIKPYIEAGYAPRHISGSYHSQGYNVDFLTGERIPYSIDGKWSPKASHGIVTGGGVEFGAGRLRIAPELRYTHWNNDPINLLGSQGY